MTFKLLVLAVWFSIYGKFYPRHVNYFIKVMKYNRSNSFISHITNQEKTNNFCFLV